MADTGGHFHASISFHCEGYSPNIKVTQFAQHW